jgi:hypothetical protein
VLPGVRPRFIVCEDGDEYLARFRRFLGEEFEFTGAPDAEAVLALAAGGDAAGLILDQDFARTPPERLVDESGRARAGLPADVRRRLAAAQGILILRLVRARGLLLPALLCADLDDADQAAYLARTLAPLAIVPSSEGLLELAARLRALGGGAAPV